MIQENLHKQYLSERDVYRTKRGVSAIWEHDGSMYHSAAVYEVKKASPNTILACISVIYDKGNHDGNRAKNESLSTEERESTRTCLLCRLPDSQDHWLHECNCGPMHVLRMIIFAYINRTLLLYLDKTALHRQLGTAFKHILMSTSSPVRIWTGIWSLSQIELLKGMVNPELITLITPSVHTPHSCLVRTT